MNGPGQILTAAAHEFGSKVALVTTLGHGYRGNAGMLSAALAMDKLIEGTGAPYRALAEPALREVVTELLAEAGRVLVSTGTGFTTGYDDRISALLAADGTGVLRTEDRAVLTLVLLLSAGPPIAEAALRESETRYRTLVDSLPDAVLLRGADGRGR